MVTSPSPDPGPVLATLHVAKDLFISDWYASGVAALFDGDHARQLNRILDESRVEREHLAAAAREWAQSDAANAATAEGLSAITRISRVEFLRDVIWAKEAAGEAIEKVALLAPPAYRERFLALAAVDFRHANTLRDILLKEFEATTADVGAPAPPDKP